MEKEIANSKPPENAFAYQALINGKWKDAAGGETFNRQSPAYDVHVGTYPLCGVEDVNEAVNAAAAALEQGAWPAMSGAERAGLLLKVAGMIEAQAEQLAYVEVLESGKPLQQAVSEMKSAAGIWTYAASLARNLNGDTYNTLGQSHLGLVFREPIGVVGMITPWNFPLLIISQKLPFALAAGCTAVIKPSELTPGTTLMLGRMLMEAGCPEGVVNIITGYGNPVGEAIANHPDVDMISFTGSTAVGKRIVQASAGNLKKVSLELGGKNPQIIFPDADLEAAMDAVLFGVYFNMGECCNSGSRILVHESIFQEFTEELIKRAVNVRVGDPLSADTQVGAIINEQQFQKITGYIESGKQQGAALRTGGNAVSGASGLFIEPTIFTEVKPDMTIAREEIFGPVLSVLRFSNLEEAIHIANNTIYGLSAGVWTKDIDTAFRLSTKVKAGTVWINTFMDGFPELSFGGYKQSGLGRELGRYSVEEFTETKTVLLHMGDRTGWWMNDKPVSAAT